MTDLYTTKSFNSNSNWLKLKNFTGTTNNPSIKIVENFFKYYANHDLEKMRSLMAKDIQWSIPGKHKLSGIKVGIDEILDFFEKLKLASFKSELIFLGSNGSYVVDSHRGYGFYGEDKIDINWVLLYQIEKGKIIRVLNFSGAPYLSDSFFKKVYGMEEIGDNFSHDAQKIINVINLSVKYVDESNWQALNNIFTANVLLDYSDLDGQKAENFKITDIITNWRNFLSKFYLTQHKISDFRVKYQGNKAVVFSRVRAIHCFKSKEIAEQMWAVDGFYQHKLQLDTKGQWKISAIKFSPVKFFGNKDLPNLITDLKVESNVFKSGKNRVYFQCGNEQIVGDLYLPRNFDIKKSISAFIVEGSWTSVKEQMEKNYAKSLAAKGFAALAFDNRHFGQSEGQPRQYENPQAKIADINAGVDFLNSLAFIRNISGLAICAGAGYMLQAVSQNKLIKNLVLVAPWLNDEAVVNMIYGGPDIVSKLIKEGKLQQRHYETTAKANYVKACSITEDDAAMYGDFDYYLNPKRGVIPQWTNSFAIMSWASWLTFRPKKNIDKISVPTIIFTSKDAALPAQAEQVINIINSTKKEVIWLDGDQFDFYDSQKIIDTITDKLVV